MVHLSASECYTKMAEMTIAAVYEDDITTDKERIWSEGKVQRALGRETLGNHVETQAVCEAVCVRSV